MILALDRINSDQSHIRLTRCGHAKAKYKKSKFVLGNGSENFRRVCTLKKIQFYAF